MVGTPTGKGYLQTRVHGRKLYNHKIIWIMHNGEVPEGMKVDHKDVSKDNNRIGNLRLATGTQNAVNTRRKNTATGVQWNPQVQKWRVRVKGLYDCHFECKLDAIATAIRVRRDCYGEFAHV